MHLVSKYGRMWARNEKNLDALGKLGKNVEGVYVLYDGTMPVYVGHGIILDRLKAHRSSGRKKDFWDYFSWYSIPDEQLQKEIETLLLKTLPYYLRLLNKQRGSFLKAHSSQPQENEVPEKVEKPKFVSIAKGQKKRTSP
jgi:hypothetical protein